MATVIKTTFKLRRGYAATWEKNNPILQAGEPGFVLDENRLKIGDGITAWNELPYLGENSIFNAATSSDFPEIGREEVIYKAANEKKLYQWNGTSLKYELIGETVEKFEKFEISSKPEGTLVRMREDEIRVMCPADTNWTLQSSGENANKNAFYIGFKAYAPSDDIYSFKEDLKEKIEDDTMYYFENNEFAGVDANGRKYSIVWLPVALYNEETMSWTYYGASSSAKAYIGWYYSVEWYDTSGKLIASDSIRINLSNEDCHNEVTPYYMGSINVNKLVQDEEDFLILYGGSATDNI